MQEVDVYSANATIFLQKLHAQQSDLISYSFEHSKHVLQKGDHTLLRPAALWSYLLYSACDWTSKE